MSTIVYPASRSTIPPLTRHPLRHLGVALLWLLGSLLVLVLALPIALLFMATAVPLYLSLALVGIDIGLVVSLFWCKRTVLLAGAVMMGVIVVSLLGIWLSQVYASTPPITDAQGNVVPGSIASLEKVKLGGVEQWLLIRGKQVDNPVLLFLSGGPGGSELGRVRLFNQPLEDHFVLVVWEQRGCGKSYAAIEPASALTVDQYVADIIELSEHLRSRFGKEKIYLVGHSWGTIIGVRAAQQRPDLFHAYIGSGQMVNVRETDQTLYQMLLDHAEKTGNTRYANTLRTLGPPPYGGPNPIGNYREVLGREYGIFEAPYIKSQAYHEYGGLLAQIFIPEYGLLDRVNFIRGAMNTFNIVYPQLQEFDFRQDARTLAVPVCFILGRHDWNSVYPLAEDYFQQLEAPLKRLYIFEDSGHGMIWQEAERFHRLMIDEVAPTHAGT